MNIFKQKLIGFIGEVSCTPDSPRTTILLPPLLNHGQLLESTSGPQFLMSFSDVFNVDLLRKFLHPRKLVSVSNGSAPHKVDSPFEFSDYSAGFAACRVNLEYTEKSLKCSASVQDRRDASALKHFLSLNSRVEFFALLKSLQPSPALTKIADKFFTDMGVDSSQTRSTYLEGGMGLVMLVHVRIIKTTKHITADENVILVFLLIFPVRSEFSASNEQSIYCCLHVAAEREKISLSPFFPNFTTHQ